MITHSFQRNKLKIYLYDPYESKLYDVIIVDNKTGDWYDGGRIYQNADGSTNVMTRSIESRPVNLNNAVNFVHFIHAHGPSLGIVTNPSQLQFNTDWMRDWQESVQKYERNKR